MTPTIDQWYAHPSFRKDLEELLNNPVFQVALEIVKTRGNRPVIPAGMPVGATLTEWFAMMGAKRDGYFEGLTNLQELTRPQTTRQPEPKAWSETVAIKKKEIS